MSSLGRNYFVVKYFSSESCRHKFFAKSLTPPLIFFQSLPFSFSQFFLRTQLYFFFLQKMRFSKEEKMLECRNWRAKPHLFIVRVGHHHSPSTYYFLCKSLALTEFYQKIGPIKVRGAYLITNCC